MQNFNDLHIILCIQMPYFAQYSLLRGTILEIHFK